MIRLSAFLWRSKRKSYQNLLLGNLNFKLNLINYEKLKHARLMPFLFFLLCQNSQEMNNCFDPGLTNDISDFILNFNQHFCNFHSKHYDSVQIKCAQDLFQVSLLLINLLCLVLFNTTSICFFSNIRSSSPPTIDPGIRWFSTINFSMAAAVFSCSSLGVMPSS